MFLGKIKRNFMNLIRRVKLSLLILKMTFGKEGESIAPIFKEINSDVDNGSYSYPKVIWLYWHSHDDIPEVVRLCVDRVRTFCPDYKVNFLNASSINEYITLPDIPDSLPLAIKADYIRLMLLEKYGGVWMDSSIFLNEDFGWISKMSSNHDAFVFYSDECTIDLDEPITENWSIISPIGSPFIKAWLKELSLCIFSEDPVNYYSSIKYDKKYVQNLTKPDYLLCYISAIKVLKESKFKVLYASSKSVGHYFNYKYQFNGSYVAAELTGVSEKKIAKVKMIKLTSGSRNSVQEFLNKGKIKTGSYIHNVIKSNFL